MGPARVRWKRNPFYHAALPAELVPSVEPDVSAFHRSLPCYAPTPLLLLPALAAELGVREVWIKDEAQRLGLNAFKVLGASYAMYRHVGQEGARQTGPGSVTFATATAGNHGRAVAWTAREGDSRLVAGESGAAGLAGLLALCREPALAEARLELGLGADTTVLLINTEGATDPASYRRIVGADP